VQRDGLPDLPANTFAELVERAFGTWSGADCGGAPPRFVVKRQPDAACAAPEYNVDINVDLGNANVVMFRDDDWPYPDGADVLGLTTITFDTQTGEIHDADIEINTHEFLFTWSDTGVSYDLLSTLVHETGHFLGVAHSDLAESVMNAKPMLGSTEHRELGADDVAAICAAYPPGVTEIAATCSPVPHDFAPGCREELPEAPEAEPRGCSVSPASARGGLPAWIIALVAFALARRRRSARRHYQPSLRALFASQALHR
jgi:MYXO-CTERM domain-containing protein